MTKRLKILEFPKPASIPPDPDRFPPAAGARSMPEKRISMIALRLSDTLKLKLEERARSLDISTSEHLRILAERDLCAQGAPCLTVSDVTGDLEAALREAQTAQRDGKISRGEAARITRPVSRALNLIWQGKKAA